MSIGLGNVKDLILGAVDLGGFTNGLPGILLDLLGGGSLKENVLKIARKKGEAQEARTAAKERARLAHKAISAVAAATPADQRAEATLRFAQAIALQQAQEAEALIAFARLAVAREAARGKGGTEEEAAIDAREAGEALVIQQGLDVGRVIAGDAPQMGDV